MDRRSEQKLHKASGLISSLHASDVSRSQDGKKHFFVNISTTFREKLMQATAAGRTRKSVKSNLFDILMNNYEYMELRNLVELLQFGD